MSFDPEQVNESNFPGLSGSMHDEDEFSQDSECSDRELFKSKDKKKEKKKDKERGYKTFETMETHSEDDDDRSKKKRSSIFRSRKAKTPKEKHKEKEPPAADEKQKEKEMMKAEKKRSKSKEREAKKERTRSKEREKFGRKKAHTISTTPAAKPVEVKPVFGIPLAEAVEHTKLFDGIELPKIVRECIDFIEEKGINHAGIYRLSGVKSKVELLRGSYNRNEEVDLSSQDPNNVASLLKQYLRELPEPPLTKALAPKLEETAAIADVKIRVPQFLHILPLLPTCNYTLLSWMVVHLAHVLQNEAETKMTIQNISIVMCPTLHISHRVLNLLFTHWETLFKDVQIKRCPKPLRWNQTEDRIELPENPSALEEELQRQEAILAKMHEDLNKGLADKCTEEHLWEVQRIVTQLKRKLRVSRRISETRIAAIEKEKEREKEKEKEKEKQKEIVRVKEAKVADENDAEKPKDDVNEEIKTELEEKSNGVEEVKTPEKDSQEKTPKKRQAPKTPADVQTDEEMVVVVEQANEPEDVTKVEIEIKETKEDAVVVETAEEDRKDEKGKDEKGKDEKGKDEDEEEAAKKAEATKKTEAKKLENENLEMIRLLLLSQAEVMAEQDELQSIHNELMKRIEAEKQEVARLKEEIAEAHSHHYRSYSVDSTDSLMSSDTSSESDEDDDTELQTILNRLIRENQELERKNTQLSHDIHNEREACVELKVQIKLRQHPYYQMEPSSIQSVKDFQAREQELQSFVKTEREVESDSEVIVSSGEVKRARRKSQSNPNVAGPMVLAGGAETPETDIDKGQNGVSSTEKGQDTPRGRRLERETSV